MVSVAFSLFFCRFTFIFCYRGMVNISSYRIWETLNIKLSSKQFLPCGYGKQNNKKVLPNIYKTLNNPPDKESCIIHLQTGWGARESFPQTVHPVLLKRRITNAFPSTLVYGMVDSIWAAPDRAASTVNNLQFPFNQPSVRSDKILSGTVLDVYFSLLPPPPPPLGCLKKPQLYSWKSVQGL